MGFPTSSPLPCLTLTHRFRTTLISSSVTPRPYPEPERRLATGQVIAMVCECSQRALNPTHFLVAVVSALLVLAQR